MLFARNTGRNERIGLKDKGNRNNGTKEQRGKKDNGTKGQRDNGIIG